jgi:hypothetical protein
VPALGSQGPAPPRRSKTPLREGMRRSVRFGLCGQKRLPRHQPVGVVRQQCAVAIAWSERVAMSHRWPSPVTRLFQIHRRCGLSCLAFPGTWEHHPTLLTTPL